jgi:S1-C subfamily serine protease
VKDSDQFVRIVGRSQAIDKIVKVQASRDGQPITLSLRPRKRQVSPTAICRDTQRLRWHGMLLGPIPAKSVSGEAVASSSTGVMVFGIDDTNAVRKDDVVVGSIITAVAGHAISDVLSLQKLVNDTPLDDNCQITARPQSK